MKLIKPSFEIKEQELGLNGIYKQIEWAGRHCYKSLDKITENSAKEFVDRMIKSGHGATLEHGTVYLKVPNSVVDEGFQFGTNWSTLCLNPYTRYNSDGEYYYYTTNYRVIIEHDLQGVLKYLCEPTEYHEKRICVKFICDRGILAEFTRHRTFSFSAESTRYCNYSKNKFNNEVTYILPCWIEEKDLPKGSCYSKDDWGSLICEFYYEATEKGKRDGINISPVKNFIFALQTNEQLYFSLLKEGWKPQQARAVLPNALKTELVMTGFVSDWRHFFELRCDSSAHPQARELAIPLKEEFIKRGYVDLG